MVLKRFVLACVGGTSIGILVEATLASRDRANPAYTIRHGITLSSPSEGPLTSSSSSATAAATAEAEAPIVGVGHDDDHGATRRRRTFTAHYRDTTAVAASAKSSSSSPSCHVTVVFDGGADQTALDWHRVHSAVVNDNRCVRCVSFDRPYLGHSIDDACNSKQQEEEGILGWLRSAFNSFCGLPFGDVFSSTPRIPPSALPRDARTHAAETIALLRSLSVTGPVVLVAHGQGAFRAATVAAACAEEHYSGDDADFEIAGVVLADPWLPGLQQRIEQASPAAAEMPARMEEMADRLVLLARVGALRVVMWAQGKKFEQKYGLQAAPFVGGATCTWTHREAVRAELSAENASEAQAAESLALGALAGDMPIVALVHGDAQAAFGDVKDDAAGEQTAEAASVDEVWASASAAFVARTSAGVCLRVPGTGHYIHRDRPEVVANAVKAVVDEVRWENRRDGGRGRLREALLQ